MPRYRSGDHADPTVSLQDSIFDLVHSLEAVDNPRGGEHVGLVNSSLVHPLLDWPPTRRWRFIVEISPSDDRIYPILVADLPDFLRLAPSLYPMLEHGEMTGFRDVAEQFFRRTFRAWHDHSLDSVCYQCDPEEAEAMARYRRKRAAERQEKQPPESAPPTT